MPMRTPGADLGPAASSGARVERAAAALLQAHGLVQVAANARYRDGELDLVMRDGAMLVFVEVRHRRHDSHGSGAASIDAGKQRRLVRAAQRFLQQQPRFEDAPCRFDVVEASGDPEAPTLHWLRDAFRADDA